MLLLDNHLTCLILEMVLLLHRVVVMVVVQRLVDLEDLGVEVLLLIMLVEVLMLLLEVMLGDQDRYLQQVLHMEQVAVAVPVALE